MSENMAEQIAAAADAAKAVVTAAAPPAPLTPRKIAAPEEMPRDAVPRSAPDVSTFDVIGAGATQEAIETDYWYLTERARSGYEEAADKIAVDLGYAPRRKEGGRGAMSLQEMDWQADRLQTLLDARAKHPEAFKDVPITEPEIMAHVNDQLKREWEDAAQTLTRAPDTFFGRMVPEFIGRMGPAATDEVNIPLALAGAGIGVAANLGRLMLIEGGLSILGEAGTLPRQIEMADRLDLPDPNIPLQLAFAGIVGAALPAGITGGAKLLKAGGTVTQVSNRALVKTLRARASDLNPEQRAAVNAIERELAEQDVGPAANGREQPAATDGALEDIAEGRPPALDAPRPDTAAATRLVTPEAEPRPDLLPGFATQAADLSTKIRSIPVSPDYAASISKIVRGLGPDYDIRVVSGGQGKAGTGAPRTGSTRHDVDDLGHAGTADLVLIHNGQEVRPGDDPALYARFIEAAAREFPGIGHYAWGVHIGSGKPAFWGPDKTGATADPTLAAAYQAGRGNPAPVLPSRARPLEQNLTGLLRDAEGAGYDTPSSFTVVQPPRRLTEMTLDEIDAWQTANRQAGAESTAAGGYQVLRDTLRTLRKDLNLDGSEKFTPELQDRLAAALMERSGLAKFKAGEISAEAFADNLAGVWASFPMADGKSRYAGDGLNAARVARDVVLGVLNGGQYTATGRPPPRMTRIPAAGVRADPQLYQFRSNVNESGVGTAMSRVNAWDELLAGDVIVHDRLDGVRNIADGHHRLDLAHRLERDGHDPIEFNAFVLREADGYTVEHVRAIAAVKNIEAGNATAIDAAKVLRVDPAMLAKLTLRNSQARDARGLMKLSDDGFDMVTNGLVDEPHAAMVGELTGDVQMQEAILRTLVAARPRSLVEARQIANDAWRAGLEKRNAGAQGSLFSDDFDIQDTLFKERAAVLAKTLAQLRNDKRVFATLVRERDRIQEAGNVTDDASNAARANTDDTALALIERLVNRAGPLDDALNDAARTARRGSTASGVREFVEIVRGAVERGDLARLLDGGTGRPRDAATPDAGANAGARSGRGEAGPQDGPAGREGGGEAASQGPDALEGVTPETAEANGLKLLGGNDWGTVYERPDGTRATWDGEQMKAETDPAARGLFWETEAEQSTALADYAAGMSAADLQAGADILAHLMAGGEIVIPNAVGKTAAQLKGKAGAERVRIRDGKVEVSTRNRGGQMLFEQLPPGYIVALRDQFVPKAQRATETTRAGDQTLIEGVEPITARQRLGAEQNAPLRGGMAQADDGLFDLGARDQPDMFSGQSDLFNDPKPAAPEIVAQVEIAERELRAALDASGDLQVPTGRTFDGEAEMMSARDILTDLDEDTDFLGALNVCKP